jgi:hypothetical protein
MTFILLLLVRIRVNFSVIKIIGESTICINFKGYTIQGHRLFQCIAPSVFGIISDRKRMAIVKKIEKTGTKAAPNTSVAYIPAILAPAVLAIVFNINIAAIGFDIFVFISMNIRASLPLFC